MERSEKIGLGIATAGHVLLFGVLSAGFLATPNPLKLNSPPMDVSLVDEVALKSTAPQISTEPPPPSQAPEEGPTEDAAPAPVPEPIPEPAAAPAPPPPKAAPAKKDVPKAKPKPPAPAKSKPAPKAKAKPAPAAPKAAAKPAKAKPKADAPAKAAGQGKAAKPRGSLLGDDFLKGIDTESPAPRRPVAPPAVAMGPAQKSALDAEIRRQLKPHWRPPSGADADRLVTLLEVRLDRNGRVIGTPEVIDQTGVTASNRPQAQLHAERAIQAVKLASPFSGLPDEFYEQWKWLRPLRFDARLTR